MIKAEKVRTPFPKVWANMQSKSYDLLPAFTNNYRGQIRVEDVIGTRSSRTEYDEIANTPIDANKSYQPRMLNLVPTSANAE